MKVEPICAVCLLSRGMEEARLATDKEDVLMKVAQGLLNLLSKEFNVNAIPAYLGRKRDRLVREITNCNDPYREAKRRSNELALKLLPQAYELLNGKRGYARFKTASLIATLGNAFEFGVLGYSFPLNQGVDLLKELSQQEVYDETYKVYGVLRKNIKILYLTDNAGEIAFDKVLIEELNMIGAQVTVMVKGAPIINDALLEDALLFKLNEVANVVTSDGDEVGFNPLDASERLRSLYLSSDLVIAKGMGHYETLSEMEISPPIVHMLKAKCQPVAKSLGVKRGSLVIKARWD
ncbi:MAG: ARMT1-like domain-containing protein [Candidatus Nezhaarchaeales archaeon]